MSTYTLPVNQLQPNPFQPREKIKIHELGELIQSIKQYGILEPLVIAETPAGYQIIAGERRWRAAKELGLEEVPVVVRKTTPKGMLEMALVENVQRSDLSPLERAQAFLQLIREFKYSHTNLAERIGKSQAYISNTLRLLELPDAIKDGLASGAITEGHGRALLSIPDEHLMIECYKIVLKENASVRRTENLARRFKKPRPDYLNTHSSKDFQILDTQIEDWEKKMQPFFNTPSHLKLSRSKRQTRVTVTLKGSPEKTQEDLEKIVEMVTRSDLELAAIDN